MLFHGLLLYLFSTVILFHQVIAIAPGVLQIQVNDGVVQGSQRVVLGSIATIRGLSTWNVQQIVDLAFVAHDDMRTAHAGANLLQTYPALALSNKVPSVTTVLVIDNTAYISSSIIGGPYLYLPNGRTTGSRFTNLDPAHPCNGPVQDALSRCQMTSINLSGHRTGASCGEAMAAMAYCATHDQASFQNKNAKIVTITGRRPENYHIVPPCGNPNNQLQYVGEWGCHDFTWPDGLDIYVIPEGTGRQPTDVATNDIAVTYATYP